MTLQVRLLLGRLLTRSGDQAWDFAVPLVLLELFPGELRIAATYYLAVKLLSVLILPKLTSLIDKLNRLSAARLGIVLQLVGVIFGAIAIYALSKSSIDIEFWRRSNTYFIFVGLVSGGLLSSLGSTFMDIAIANDLVPASIEAGALGKFNSRLRQLDLFTEVTSPVAAGLLLTINPAQLVGFFVIAAWNMASFIPELLLIQSVLREKPVLLERKVRVPQSAEVSLVGNIAGGWRAFFNEPVALVALAYSFLWLSALSPHGVLLTGFLKDGWKFPEWAIGVFRAGGAVFGLIATIVFPWGERRWGLINASRNFLVFQTLALLLGFFMMVTGSFVGQIGFLICILLSRIGLYGFGLGEMQIRQIGIKSSSRGEVNGFANSLTGVATLLLFTFGSALPTTNDFKYLIAGSVFFVAVGCVTFLIWKTKPYALQLESHSLKQESFL